MWGQEQAGVLPCQDIEGDCVCLHPARLTVPHNNCTRGRHGEGPTQAQCSRKCTLKIKKPFVFDLFIYFFWLDKNIIYLFSYIFCLFSEEKRFLKKIIIILHIQYFKIFLMCSTAEQETKNIYLFILIFIYLFICTQYPLFTKNLMKDI